MAQWEVVELEGPGQAWARGPYWGRSGTREEGPGDAQVDIAWSMSLSRISENSSEVR